MRALRGSILAAACAGLLTAPVHAIDEEHAGRGRAAAAKAAEFLRSKQDVATGGWSVPATVEGQPRPPVMPAISALALNGLLLKGESIRDPALARGVSFVLSLRQPDGGIYDRVLPSYNTAISLSMLARVGSPEAGAAIRPAQDFVRAGQWWEGAGPGVGAEVPGKVGADHPFYGGVGYGKHSRPDLSNLAFMLQALHDSGVPADDAAFTRARIFLARVQMVDAVNDMPYADGTRQGGFIYATGPEGDQPGVGQSFAGSIDETLDDGTTVSRLRAYGSMTYAGFKSLIYAGLKKDDPRVVAATGWIARNYTLEENPGLGTDGMYYYYLMFARAMDARAEPTLNVITPDGAATERDWANDLIDRLVSLQQADGSFRVVDDRWMENDGVLIASYALIALGHALGGGAN
ncbi:MAG: hypothetical protein JNM07_10470 [Phycisphaerae bacterium]|nr:hypothetical protein [Phycisphaerae bacterium]